MAKKKTTKTPTRSKGKKGKLGKTEKVLLLILGGIILTLVIWTIVRAAKNGSRSSLTESPSATPTPTASAPKTTRAPSVSGTCSSGMFPLKMGSRNECVKEVQRQLNKKGANLVVDGIWGPKTESAALSIFGKNTIKSKSELDSLGGSFGSTAMGSVLNTLR